MAAVLTVTPNPTPPQMMNVHGEGFDRKVFVALVFRGNGVTTKFKPRPNGSFDVGVDVASNTPDGTYTLEARKAGTSTVLATVSVQVKKPVPPPADTTAPKILTWQVLNVTKTSAQIKWTLDEASTGQVDYGLTTAYGSSTTFEPSFLLGHTQNITGLASGTPYKFRIRSKDAAANMVTQEGEFTTVTDVVIPPNEKVVSVTNITDLRKYLADNTVDRIICEDGRYISNGGTGAGSLWIGSQTSGGAPFMERTRPIIVQARNKHKAIIEGGYLSFEDGAHHQTWDGFRHSNMTVSSNGVINFGGYFARRSPHHITIKNLWIDDTCKAAKGPNASQDHAIYPAHALGEGPNNILIEDFRIDAVNLNGALHSWHPEPGQDGMPPKDITYRRGLITNPWWGIVGGHTTPVYGFVFEDLRIEGARRSAIAWDLVNPHDFTLRRVVTVNSKLVFEHKWSAKPLPPGIPGFIIEDCSFA